MSATKTADEKGEPDVGSKSEKGADADRERLLRSIKGRANAVLKCSQRRRRGQRSEVLTPQRLTPQSMEMGRWRGKRRRDRSVFIHHLWLCSLNQDFYFSRLDMIVALCESL